MRRRIENPVIGDVVTFVETSAETGGARSVLEIELAPGGGNDPHMHQTYDERFEVLEGRIVVRSGDARHELAVGEQADAPRGTVHCFSNPFGERARFRVTLTPGHEGFERSLAIAYGLAADGKTDKGSVPRNPLHLALLVDMSEMRLPGAKGAVLAPLRFLAPVARRLGVERELERRYLAPDPSPPGAPS